MTTGAGLLLVGGSWAVVTVLDSQTPAVEITERCTATSADGTFRFSPEQTANAALIGIHPLALQMPARAGTIGLATAMQESTMYNLDYGDRDSLGLFQQRPSQGWGTKKQVQNPLYSTRKFYTALNKVQGYTDMEITVAAQTVQRSGFPDAYAQHEGMARAWASALHGYTPAAVNCVLKPAEPGASSKAIVKRAARDIPGVEIESVKSTAIDSDATRAPQIVVTMSANQAAQAFGLGDAETERIGWALANWAVAVAKDTSIVQVTYGNNTWLRSAGQWAPLRSSTDTDDPGANESGSGSAANDVILTLS